MKVHRMVAAELRRLVSTRMLALALFALLCVPILYGGLYLWANQDPYGRLGSIPVALVNQDKGAPIEGERRDLGAEVIKRLVETRTFAFSEVDTAEAEAGLASGRYDFAIVIPADFSAAIASVNDAKPRQTSIELHANDANNYLATTIGRNAAAEVQAEIRQKVVETVGLALFNGLAEIRTKLVDAGKGADELASGLKTALSGSDRLAKGTKSLASGVKELDTGADRLASGAKQVAAGVNKLDAIADDVADVTRAAQARLPQVRRDIRNALRDAGLSRSEINEVLAALDPIGTRLNQLGNRVQRTVNRIDQLDAGAREVASGAAKLARGTESARKGTDQVHSGVVELSDGLGKLSSGADELSSGLADGLKQLPDHNRDTRQEQSRILSDPVTVDTTQLSQAQNYGAGLAPFFAALAAWIGIYALFLIVKPVSRRALTAMEAPVRVSIAGWLTPAALGLVQMIGLFAVLWIALEFNFANPWATLGLLVFASACYTWIILALNVWLGTVGEFLGLVLMVLQLVTAGGTFPWQTLPEPLAALHKVLPMGYVVDALRQVMYGGDLSRVWSDLAVVGIWALVAAAITIAGVTRMTHHLTMGQLQPSILQ